MPIALSINLNKIALLRNSRPGNFPNVVEHGKMCLDAGAQGLTVHPRPDQRHIRPHDVYDLAALVKRYAGCEFNIEGNPFAPPLEDYPGLLALVQATQPQQVTLVPDSQKQLTSDHGFDLFQDGDRLAPIIEQLHGFGARVSLFMDPDIEQIGLAKEVGADRIELYTGPFADAYAAKSSRLDGLYQRYVDAALAATDLSLGVNAGHDLNLHNLQLFNQLPNLAEVSIGHALTVDALNLGLAIAVTEYLKLCQP